MGASSQPAYPFPDGTVGALPPDPQPGKPGHFAFTRWIREFARKLDRETVKLSGDTMTGALVVLPPTAPRHPATKEYVDLASSSGVPLGVIAMYGGSTAPEGWHLCDGTPHGSAALQAKIGSPNTPDLRDRFVVAAGGKYRSGDRGGVELVTLTANQSGLRQHSHWVDPPSAATSAVNLHHAHNGWTGDGPHSHNHYASNLLSAEGAFDPSGTGHKFLIGADNHIISGGNHSHTVGIDGQLGDHQHNVDIPGFHSSGEGPWSAAEAHENRPPYYAVTFIMKKV